VRIAWVPQLPMMLPGRSVLDNVLLARRVVDDAGEIDVDGARNLLVNVGLADLADRDVSVLSGGEAQRLAVARALFTNAPLILADEPTASLGRENSARIIDALIRNRGRACVIVATHDDRVASACQRIVRLADGRVEEVLS
jgi:ABC-type antimicrobial peptide transport system, ATPase component